MNYGRVARICLLPAILVLLAAAVLPGLADEDEKKIAGVMGRIVEEFNSGDYEGIYGMFNEIMQSRTKKEDAVAIFTKLSGAFGKIVKVSEAQMLNPLEATFVLTFERGIVDARLLLDSGDKVAGLNLAPRPPAAKVPERQTVQLRLPFEGTWLVLAGGDNPVQNEHVQGHPSQRYAYDFVAAGPDGKHFKTEGKTNADYYAFGRKVLAPADGVVVEIISGVRDNRPGVSNPFVHLGNMVVIKHATGEYSLLGHLKYASILVSRGASVKMGQQIALCGNSGAVKEPQLHYSVMNTNNPVEATGIKALFRRIKVIRDGQASVKTDFMPVKGDLVAHN